MNTNLSPKQDAKTQADNEAKLLEMRAVAAFRNGDFANMFKFDALARRRRITNRADFFEANLQAVTAEQKPPAKTVCVTPPVTRPPRL